ncbi:hypothetical protein BDY24DRAFT_230247 [Mrakia frigida]|uniref:uncharacterized protein n=1 Tax=Mrakia frigida TaxID=29902 RepID=UPI003FCC1958
MAAQVIGLIVPAVPSDSDVSIVDRITAEEEQADVLADALLVWCGRLSPHPLCSLISTVILLERLFSLYPKIADAVVSSDTFLRLTFASFLISIKQISESSYMNSSLVPYTPWTLPNINVMEKEMLGCLRFDVFISTTQFLHRASGFWDRHLLLRSTRPSSPPTDLFFTDPFSASTSNATTTASPAALSSSTLNGNLFLTQRRPGVKERRWKGGLVRSCSEMGSRLTDVAREEETVWRDGRLERSGSWGRARSSPGSKRGGKSKKEEGEVVGGAVSTRR